MLLGAHVSTAGGMSNAPQRAVEIGATAVQVFTKQPNRWAERPIQEEEGRGFREGMARAGVGFTCSHDSYLINLATADPILLERSLESFVGELERARALDLDAVVTHPGNATDGDHERGLEQNAKMIERALLRVPARTMVLLETTAGAGNVLGSRFEELARIMDGVSPAVRGRVGVCVDTCHVFAAGYDLLEDYDGVFREFEGTIGLRNLHLFHLNDSQKPFASRKDRHADIGEGTLGDEPFRRIMNDPRFSAVPKVLETPKGDDHTAADRRNLARLRSYLPET